MGDPSITPGYDLLDSGVVSEVQNAMQMDLPTDNSSDGMDVEGQLANVSLNVNTDLLSPSAKFSNERNIQQDGTNGNKRPPDENDQQQKKRPKIVTES